MKKVLIVIGAVIAALVGLVLNGGAQNINNMRRAA
jgi:sensor domain CHASE-containing protein